jgi:hypothetical protein
MLDRRREYLEQTMLATVMMVKWSMAISLSLKQDRLRRLFPPTITHCFFSITYIHFVALSS